MSLYVLDTDTVSLYQAGHAGVVQRVMLHSPQDLAVAVLTVEELLVGWLTRLRRFKARDQVAYSYRKMGETVTMLSRFQILTYAESTMQRYDALTAQKLGVRSTDLRISAVALEN